MSRQVCGHVMGMCVVLVMVLSGCSQRADLSLQFSPDETTAYKSVSDVIKDFRFEQPNADKLREEQTRTSIDMDFTQTIQSVDDTGNATARITIDALKVTIINKNETRFEFDSAKEADTNSPLTKLLGQSYTIQITPHGQVTVVEAAQALKAVPSGYENKIAASLLNEDNIIQRHEIAALPADNTDELAVGKSWEMVVDSPPGLLAPKSYQKVYTLTDISNNVATVKMVGNEAAETPEGTPAGGMGMFARMFDNEDTYTGLMEMNVETGDVQLAQETLVSTYLAQEMPENGDPAKGPDTLTMQFTHKMRLEKLD